MRLRWNMMILGGTLFFAGFAMWLNGIPMGEDNPFNDSLFPLFVFFGLVIGLPYYVTPYIMKLKSPNIDGNGLSDTLDTGEPLIVIEPIMAIDKQGLVKSQSGKKIITYPRYSIYNLGGASAFGLRLRGGGYNGIGVFPTRLIERNGASVQLKVADIEIFQSEEDKLKLPQHVLDRIKHEYTIRGWSWNDEFPIYWGEIPAQVTPVPVSVANLWERCKAVEEERKNWEKIARQYETEAIKQDSRIQPIQPPQPIIQLPQQGRDE